jgi:hypothetical protein
MGLFDEIDAFIFFGAFRAHPGPGGMEACAYRVLRGRSGGGFFGRVILCFMELRTEST